MISNVENSAKGGINKIYEKLLNSGCILAVPLKFCEVKIIGPLDKKANLKEGCAKTAIKIANFFLKFFIYLLCVPLAFAGLLGETCFCYSIENSPCKKICKKLLERKFISKLYKKHQEIEERMKILFEEYEKNNKNLKNYFETFKNRSENVIEEEKKEFEGMGWVYCKDRNFVGSSKSLNDKIKDYTEESIESTKKGEEKKFCKESETIKANSLPELKIAWDAWIENSYESVGGNKEKEICFKCIYASGIEHSKTEGRYSISFDYVQCGKEIREDIKKRSQMSRIRKIFCCCC